MNIEIISIPDCPNHRPTVDRVRALLTSEAILADVAEVLVSTESEATALRFIGSPTVRVNGKDVEPLLSFRMGLACRIYGDGSGVPPEALLKEAIMSAKELESQR
jgi:hypothetical protein